jgi:uncharacterized membrane protein YvlD (DUF360 family)
MNYLKGLLINFLLVFFSNHILPGIEVTDMSKIPHIGGDLIFSVALGFLNASICPALKLLRQEISIVKLVLIVLILNFVSYAIVKFLPLGIQITNLEGFLLGASVVSIGSFVYNFFEMKRHRQPPHQMPPQ